MSLRQLRGEEEWARAILQRELGVRVVQHDDGSKPGMYDLGAEYPNERVAAIEVTAAADAETIEFWNLMNTPGRWISPELDGGWAVHVAPSARVRDLREKLPALLKGFETVGRRTYGRRAGFQNPVEVAEQIGIISASQSATDYPGSIYVLPELPPDRVSGFVAGTGDALAEWLGRFLSETEDVRKKLAASGADERHAFVVVPGFTPAQFDVVDLLIRRRAPLPTVDPALPSEVTHVWAASMWATGSGFGWSPERGWFAFIKDIESDETA